MNGHRIALLTDIHANLPALRDVLVDLAAQQARAPFDAILPGRPGRLWRGAGGSNRDLVMALNCPTILGNY